MRVMRQAVRAPSLVARMFVGPIFQREVRALGRRRMPYWVRSLYTLLLAGIVALVFFSIWESGSARSSFGGYAQQSMLEVLAPSMLITVAVVQMAALGLIAPVLTAGAISDEKRQRTLSTLLTTPLTSRDIILGKLGARTVQLVILSLVPMPLLLALRVFGGVEAEAIVASMLLGLCVGLLGASLALMFSIWHRRTPSIVFFALCATAVLVFLPILAMFIAQWSFAIDDDSIFFKAIAPVALVAVLLPEDIGFASVADVREFWVASVTYLLGLCAGIVAFSIVVLRGVLKREAAGSDSASLVARLVAPGVEGVRKPGEDSSRDAREVGDRPVLWRELRQTAMGSGKRTLLAFGLGIAILMVMYITIGLDHSGITITLLMILALALTAQAALSTPAAIAAERDAGSWGVLLTTPVRSGQIVLGKTLGSIRRLWLAPAVVAFHLVLAMAAGWFHPIGALHATMLLGSLVFMLGCTGVCLGLVCRRGVTASVLNMGLPLLLFLGLPIAVGLYLQFTYYNSYYDDPPRWISQLIMISNPFIMLQEAATTATGEFDRFSFTLRYEMLDSDRTVRPLRFTLLTLMCCGAMIALGSAALGIAIAGFNRWTGRSS